MSAQLQQSNSFSAHLALAAGVAVSITAGSLDELAGVVAKLQGKPAANETKPAATETKPRGQDAAQAAADKTPEKNRDGEAPNASASTGTQASAPTAASGSAPAGDAPRPTYEDVKAKVLALSKKSRDLAVNTLGQFKTVAGAAVDHGNKLQLEDYPAFIAAADKVLGA